MNRSPFSRRDFIIGAAIGSVTGAGILAALLRKKINSASTLTNASVFHTDRIARIANLSYIAVDYAHCSGCRICEAECCLVREKSFDLWRSRIRLHRFEPTIDIAAICAGCADAPCVASCPTEAGALGRDPLTGAVMLNEDKCIGCQACLNSCAKDRSGIIRMSRDGKKALGICDLCRGDPACVKVCPEKCLSIVPANIDGKNLAAKPSAIAGSLSRSLYRLRRGS
jgi:Fe-S-cluster-containing hydrogenase component 2